MIKVALAGNIASGKSSVEQYLKAKNYSVLDTDEVTHSLFKTENVKQELIDVFSSFDIVDENEISRSKLGNIVFENIGLRSKLEAVMHPKIKSEVIKFLKEKEQKGEEIAFVSAPLLFEAKMDQLFDKIILISSDDEIRLKRLMLRNSLTKEQAQNRIQIQMSQDEKEPLSDYVVYNNGSLEDLYLMVDDILKLL